MGQLEGGPVWRNGLTAGVSLLFWGGLGINRQRTDFRGQVYCRPPLKIRRTIHEETYVPNHEIAGVFGLPLLAAALFAVATLCLKLAAKAKVDIWRTNFISNLLTAICFQPFWLVSGELPSWELWWQPAIVAALYIVGQVLTLLSLTKGEVSIAAPVLGLKLMVVPLFIFVIGAGELPKSIWLACGTAALAVVLLNVSRHRVTRGTLLFSVLAAAAGAGAFAMFDVCVQLWSKDWGHGGFLPVMFLFSTLFSLAFIPLFDEGLAKLSPLAKRALAGVGVFFALQALAIVISVAYWQKAASSNVVYSTRGLCSLLVVACFGGWLGVQDAGLDRRTLVFRLVGALLMMVAIVILLV